MTHVAYSKRDHRRIRKLKRLHTLYELTSLGLRKLTAYGRKGLQRLLVYPVITDKETLGDVVNRLRFALPDDGHYEVRIPVSKALLQTNPDELPVPSSQQKFPHRHSHFHFIESAAVRPAQADALLLHRCSALREPRILAHLHKTYILDKEYYSSVEASTLRAIYYETLTEQRRQAFQAASKNIYSEMLHPAPKAYCFATGPSFDRYREFQYEPEAFKVICNSTVKNHDFLRYIGNPHVLVFADPVFHFSPCRYAAVFRQQVLDAFRTFQFHIAVPHYTQPLLLQHFPELEGKLIGMYMRRYLPLNFPTPEKFWVKSTANILTALMLPIASAAADAIYIIGADGREKGENYFWKHSKTAQYDDLMQSAFDTHPSFFRDRDYEDYYDEHCAFLEKMIEFGEANGKKYFSLTPSYIPALRERRIK
ncbi:MAG: hypothetical protein KatS3mg031_1539 [Chitinophagales bacterium]|nr:MAG: hypothetical protein KatS3mg031_1539 [Chitinophagales bacterium]